MKNKNKRRHETASCLNSLNLASRLLGESLFIDFSNDSKGKSCCGSQERMWMKQLDTLGLASISRQIRLGGELCVHSPAPKASHDRMRRQWRRALLFNRLLLFRCHCNVIKCVSPCQKDLNLPVGFYCLIQHKFPGWRSKENINDLISERSVSLVSHLPARTICLFTCFSLLSSHTFRTQSQNPKAFCRYDFYSIWIHSSFRAIADGGAWC